MMKQLAFAAALAVLPATVFAQSTGPVIPDPAGGTTRDPALAAGAVAGFRTYVMQQSVPSYRYSSPVVVGAILPDEGIVYREIPAEYGAPGYRYTVVNERAVVVEPRTRRIIQVID